MVLDEIEPTNEMYVIAVRPDSEGHLSIRGRNYQADYIRCPLNWDDKLIGDMVNGCLIRWDIAVRCKDQKTKRIVARVFHGFKEIYYRNK